MRGPVSNQPEQKPPLLNLSKVSKTFDNGVAALESVSLDVREDDLVALVGPSGCGKSTILRLIAGLDHCSSGTLDWAEGWSGEGLGMILQEPTLMPWASVEDNVWLPMRLKGWEKKSIQAAIDEMLELVGLADFQKRYPNELSGGMKMRVSIARALITRPRLLLMDEPFAALDEISRFKLNDDLLALKQKTGCTIIFVTHSVFESVFLANRVVVMSPRPGRLAGELAIGMPYPRSEDFRTSAQYSRYCQEVSTLLRQAG